MGAGQSMVAVWPCGLLRTRLGGRHATTGVRRDPREVEVFPWLPGAVTWSVRGAAVTERMLFPMRERTQSLTMRFLRCSLNFTSLRLWHRLNIDLTMKRLFSL